MTINLCTPTKMSNYRETSRVWVQKNVQFVNKVSKKVGKKITKSSKLEKLQKSLKGEAESNGKVSKCMWVINGRAAASSVQLVHQIFCTTVREP